MNVLESKGQWWSLALQALFLHLENRNHPSLRCTASHKGLSLILVVCRVYSVNLVARQVFDILLRRGIQDRVGDYHLLFRCSASFLLPSHWLRGWTLVNTSSTSQQALPCSQVSTWCTWGCRLPSLVDSSPQHAVLLRVDMSNVQRAS